MLETFVSSRIKRTLFEYLLTHADTQFYLRGLAKELRLSVTPLRRELKRLERTGLLRTVPEGNMLFYTINTISPHYQELKSMSVQPQPAAGGGVVPAVAQAAVSWIGAQSVEWQPASGSDGSALPAAEPAADAPAQPAAKPRGIGAAFFGPLSTPMMVGVATMGGLLIAVVATLVYLTLVHQTSTSQATRLLATRKAEVTVVVAPPAASGAMRGSRWQIVPGGFGGFSSSGSEETY